jgi:Condensation domain
MSEDKRALLKQRMETGQLRLQPLTLPQRELWEASPVPVADMANHICCLIEIRGKVTPDDGAAALKLVVDRQEALRISFLSGKERPVQMIRNGGAMNMRFRELSPSQSQPQALEEIASEIFREPFDLLQGPLYRAELMRRAADDHVLAFAIHHAIADGWTLGIFIRDLCHAYIQRLFGIQRLLGMREALAPIALTYTAWGAAERAFWTPQVLESRAAFWKAHLAGYRRLWNALEGPNTEAGAHVRLVSHFPADLVKAVRELARRSRATLFGALLTAFQITLSRWTGADDILVGTPVANRSKEAVKKTMGYFAGIVPLRGRVDADRSFSSALCVTHQTTVDCFANAMPFAELAQALGDAGAPGHNPIFEVRIALQNHPIPDVALPGLSAKLRMRSTGTARYHLACEMTEDKEQLEVVWLFRPLLFPQAEVENLGRMFKDVLTAACRSPEARIADLSNSLR